MTESRSSSSYGWLLGLLNRIIIPSNFYSNSILFTMYRPATPHTPAGPGGWLNPVDTPKEQTPPRGLSLNLNRAIPKAVTSAFSDVVPIPKHKRAPPSPLEDEHSAMGPTTTSKKQASVPVSVDAKIMPPSMLLMCPGTPYTDPHEQAPAGFMYVYKQISAPNFSSAGPGAGADGSGSGSDAPQQQQQRAVTTANKPFIVNGAPVVMPGKHGKSGSFLLTGGGKALSLDKQGRIIGYDGHGLDYVKKDGGDNQERQKTRQAADDELSIRALLAF